MRGSVPALALAAVLVAGAGGVAEAKSQRDFIYPIDQVWATLVRFLRVDEHVKILEKDGEAGYVVFELTDGKRTFSGSAELLKLDSGTRVMIRLLDRPSYLETGMLDRLAQKLHDELPAPPPPPPTRPRDDKTD